MVSSTCPLRATGPLAVTPATHTPIHGASPEFSLKGCWGGGVLEPKSPKVCVPKTAQINISFGKISFFPAMNSGSEGGGVRTPPPAPPTGDAESLSKTLCIKHEKGARDRHNVCSASTHTRCVLNSAEEECAGPVEAGTIVVLIAWHRPARHFVARAGPCAPMSLRWGLKPTL